MKGSPMHRNFSVGTPNKQTYDVNDTDERVYNIDETDYDNWRGSDKAGPSKSGAPGISTLGQKENKAHLEAYLSSKKSKSEGETDLERINREKKEFQSKDLGK